jgi:hypothetical protein
MTVVTVNLNNVQSTTKKGVANGYASLDGGGKVPISQLPNSVMELQGFWNAFTNTPALANGTGNAGDVWEVNVEGIVNFGAGNIAFKVGDWAVYGATGVWGNSKNSNEVTSVNGYTGTVVLAANDVGAIGNNTDTYATAKIQQVISLTQAEYDAIGTKNANTLYVIL